ncbi:MAG: beta-galactosidase [Anaerolineales bacterium]|nr:MAG: beta-galactosidase [Anaerolineales bacterium]
MASSTFTNYVLRPGLRLGAMLLLTLGAAACATEQPPPDASIAPATNSPASLVPSPTPEPTAWPSPTSDPPVGETPTGSGQPTPAAMSSPDYGMQAFLFWREEVADRDLKLIDEAGFRWVKQEFAWREIEGAQPGIFNWANTDRVMDQIDSYGLNVIARVGVQPQWASDVYPEVGPPDNYQDFANFLGALATRYRGRIDAYQIWNEPNLAREWGNRPPNPAEYSEMLKVAYQAIKAIDPSAHIISAGLAPTTRWDDVAVPDTVFLQAMYDAGAAPYFDLMGAHGAGYKAAPETDPDVVANDPILNNYDPNPPELKRIYCFRHVEDVREVMVANGDAQKRVVLLEFGWTTDHRPDSPYAWHAVGDQEQAEYLVRAYKYAQEHWQPWIAVMSLIYMPDSQWGKGDEQTYWSIIYPGYPDLRMRPAYMQLKAMPKD